MTIHTEVDKLHVDRVEQPYGLPQKKLNLLNNKSYFMQKIYSYTTVLLCTQRQ